MTLPEQHLLFLSSSDSINISPGNSPDDFTVDLGKTLYLPGEWRVELLSFRCELSNAQQYDIKNLYVFTDLCECSYVRDQYLPLLTNIYLNDDNTVVRKVAETFHTPHKLGVVPHTVQRIRVYIRDSNLLTPSFTTQRAEVTLRLVKYEHSNASL